jgi:hypothetical protein
MEIMCHALRKELSGDEKTSRLCPKRFYCERYTALPNMTHQSYFTEAPFDIQTKECVEFIKNKEWEKHERAKHKKSTAI